MPNELSELAKILERYETHHFWVLMPYKIKSLVVQLGVFYQDVHDQFNFAVLLGQICSLLVVASLPTHSNCSLEVKLQVTGRFDKCLQFVDIFELCIAVQK